MSDAGMLALFALPSGQASSDAVQRAGQLDTGYSFTALRLYETLDPWISFDESTVA